MKKQVLIPIVAMGVLAAGAVAVAQQAEPAPAASPAAAAEHGPKQMWERRFGPMDADKDGKITYEEFAKFNEQKQKERFTRFDRNGDGVLSPDDVPAPKPRPEGDAAMPGATNAPAAKPAQ